MSSDDEPFEIAMPCSQHGFQMWKNHACCKNCGRVFEGAKTDWSGPAFSEPPVVLPPCACGSTDFGRICPKCFKHWNKKGGRVPVEKRKSN